MKNIKPFLLCCLLSVNHAAANAQTSEIEFKNEAFKEIEVVNGQGEKEFKLEPPGTVVPKDEILYVLTFTNTGSKAATDIIINNPLPNNSLYKQGSAFGAGTEITFSTDGGSSYLKPEALKVRADGGGLVAAEPKDYTHIRWIYRGKLSPGAEGTVTYRTIIK